MRKLKKYWLLIVVCVVQIISITLDAKGLITWEWYYVYAPALFIGATAVITPYVALAVYYYNSKD